MSGTSEGLDLVLASSSPRRKRLLAQAGIRFRAVAPPLAEPEQMPGGLCPSEQAEALAYFKAKAVWDLVEGAYVLGADTIVSAGGRVLGKPANEADARHMLWSLAGTRHEVITGVALLGPHQTRLIASAQTFVTMRPITPEELDAYIGTGEWAGKAGAYAIQETGDRFVVAVEGSYSNVVGLPLELVARMLRELRDRPEAHGPARQDETLPDRERPGRREDA